MRVLIGSGRAARGTVVSPIWMSPSVSARSPSASVAAWPSAPARPLARTKATAEPFEACEEPGPLGPEAFGRCSRTTEGPGLEGDGSCLRLLQRRRRSPLQTFTEVVVSESLWGPRVVGAGPRRYESAVDALA